jgi:hypothetical protein
MQALTALNYLKLWKESQLNSVSALGADPPAEFGGLAFSHSRSRCSEELEAKLAARPDPA